MKMRNDDLKKITEIKQYLLDPPTSFKLNEYAIERLQQAMAVLTPYSNANDTIVFLQSLLRQLQNRSIPQEELRKTLINAGRKLSHLTNR